MTNAKVLKSILAGMAIATFSLGASAVPASAGGCSADAMKLINNLKGSWRGTGTVTPIGGARGRISCRVTYKERSQRVSQKISCRGADYNFEASAKVKCNNSALTGMWEEKVAHNTGGVTGSIKGTRLRLSIDGPNFKGRIAVTIANNRRHSLTITQFDPAAGRQVPVAKVSLKH
ncbi:MAG: hypothetical protein P8Y67_02090 [Alphaproteobacteria bacterium]